MGPKRYLFAPRTDKVYVKLLLKSGVSDLRPTQGRGKYDPNLFKLLKTSGLSYFIIKQLTFSKLNEILRP